MAHSSPVRPTAATEPSRWDGASGASRGKGMVTGRMSEGSTSSTAMSGSPSSAGTAGMVVDAAGVFGGGTDTGDVGVSASRVTTARTTRSAPASTRDAGTASAHGSVRRVSAVPAPRWRHGPPSCSVSHELHVATAMVGYRSIRPRS